MAEWRRVLTPLREQNQEGYVKRGETFLAGISRQGGVSYGG